MFIYIALLLLVIGGISVVSGLDPVKILTMYGVPAIVFALLAIAVAVKDLEEKIK